MPPHHLHHHHHLQGDSILENAGMVPYGILDHNQTSSPYSVLQNPETSPYSVLEAAVPLWGPPPPYSSPARRFVYRTNEHRTRQQTTSTKRNDSFPMREGKSFKILSSIFVFESIV